MASLHHITGLHPIMGSHSHTHTRQTRRWLGLSLAGLLAVGSAGFAFAQNDDPGNLTVPDGLERGTENPLPANALDSADPPQTEVNEEARQERVIGELVRIDGNTLTIVHEDRERIFRIPAGVKVTRDGEPVRLRQLQLKDVIRIERGIAPDAVTTVVAVSPAPAGERDPDPELRSERRSAADHARMPQSAPTQTPVAGAAGGRVWVVLLESDSSLAGSGLRPGDMIIVADRTMLQRDEALPGIAAGLFPLRSTADGAIVVSPNAAGVSILGTGTAVPTGVNIGVGTPGTSVGSGAGNVGPNSTVPPATDVGDSNFGPPIGQRPGGGDRNFGPSIGTGNAAGAEPAQQPRPGEQPAQQPQPGQQPAQQPQSELPPPAPSTP